MPAQDPEELLPVVDEADQQVGLASRAQIHAQGLKHRAVHVLVFAPDGRLWLQRRSQAKDRYPGLWTSSASGHVDPGESYDQAAARELKEELGLELALTYLGKVAAGPATEGEFTAVYMAVSAKEPQPDAAEIAEMGLFNLAQARSLAADLKKAAPSLGAAMAMLTS